MTKVKEDFPVSTERWLKDFYCVGNYPIHPLAQAESGDTLTFIGWMNILFCLGVSTS